MLIKKKTLTHFYSRLGFQLVESAGIEPASKQDIEKLSTDLVFV